MAGSITYYDINNELDKAKEWRRQAADLLNDKFKIFNPIINYETNKTFNNKGVVYQNLYYLNKSQIMLLNMENLDKSPGTLFEMFNFWANHKPVIAFGKTPIYNQPHVQEAITNWFINVDKAIDYINFMYCQ